MIWSNPGDGSGVQSIVPAVPSTSGVADVFAFQADGTVQAITSDGTTAWTATVGWRAMPDFQGGLVTVGQDGSSIYKLDGITGQPYPAYTWDPSAANLSLAGVHTDGTIFAIENREQSVIGIDPTTGTQKFNVRIPIGTALGDTWQTGGGALSFLIAGDGNAYVPYTWRESTGAGGPAGALNHFRLLRVSSAGAYDDIPIYDWNSAYTDNIPSPLGGIITNADQGVLLTFREESGGAMGQPSMATTTGASASIVSGPQSPSGGSVVPMLQAQDGSFVGTFPDPNTYNNDMVAFDATGATRWIVPNETPQIATADGGVIGQSGITYDQNGNATGQMMNLLSQPAYSWIQQWYSPMYGQTAALNLAIVQWATSYTAVQGGNPSSQGTAVGVAVSPDGNPVFGLPNRGPGCQLPPGGGSKVPLGGAALTQFHAEGSALMLGNYLTSSSCSAFFNGTPLGANYLNPVSLAVIGQVPYDGPQSTISMYDAGMSDGRIPIEVSIKKRSPVCGEFVPWHGPHGTVRPNGSTTAESQISVVPPGSGPATDTYINTSPKALAYLTQATILHESLHNLTGLYDFVDEDSRTRYGYQPPYDLMTFVAVEPVPGVVPTPSSTIIISRQLVSQGCAGAY